MSEVKFTKGPWKIGVAGPNGCPTVGTTTGLMVCHIAHSINEDDQKSQALGNARLIKAAPEMLELLEKLFVAAMDYIEYEHDGDPFTEDARAMREMEIDTLHSDGTLDRCEQLLAEIRGE